MAIKLSAGAAKFISETFPSVACLEMLLLVRESPNRSWTADDVAMALRLTPAALPDRLDNLTSRGLLKRRTGPVPNYHYRPRTPEIQALVEEIAAAYKDHCHTVIAQIHGSMPPTA